MLLLCISWIIELLCPVASLCLLCTSLVLIFYSTTGAIKRKVELDWGTEDSEYLQKVELHMEGTLNEVLPDIIVYNAGTDILDGDPLGGLSISPQVLSLLIILYKGFRVAFICPF